MTTEFRALPNHEGVYFHSQFPDLAAAYTIFGALRISGRLDHGALAAALAHVYRRHEALRSTFRFSEAGLVQRISRVDETVPVPLTRISLAGLPAHARAERMAAMARHEAERRFDLNHGPLVRYLLVELSPSESLLTISLHHLVADAWSLALLLKDFVAFYRAYADGVVPPAAVLPPLADATAELRAPLADGAVGAERERWLQGLRGLPYANIPCLTGLGVPRSWGVPLRLLLEEPLSAALPRFARELQVTPFAVLMAAFKVLLYKYGADPAGLLRVPFANRQRHRKLCGFFVNTLPVRSVVDAEESFGDCLRATYADLLAASAHQRYPGTLVDRELSKGAPRAPSSIFGTIVEVSPLSPESIGSWRGGECRFRPVDLDFAPAPFNLATSFVWAGSRVHTTWIFNPGIYPEAFVHQAAHHYGTLLGGLMAKPEGKLARVPLAAQGPSPATSLRRAKSGGIASMLEAQRLKTPDLIAIASGGESVTYQEIGRRIAPILASLRQSGVRPGEPVGMVAQPTVQTILAMLAVLEYGAAFVPLNKSDPDARRQALGASVGGRWLWDGASFVPWMSTQERADPEVPLPADLAYVLFTSGSTGIPKGVMITQGNLAVQMDALLRAYPKLKGRRYILLAALTFDASLEQILLPLLSGGTLFLPGPLVSHDPVCLWQFVAEHDIEVVGTVPSVMAILLQAAPPGQRVPIVNLGGERLTVPLVRRTAQRLKPDLLVNSYGPTEVTINAAMHDCADGTAAIGRPLPGYPCLVLDRDRNVVPDGVAGELFIGGAGIAAGYLNDDALTERRFVDLLPEAGRAGGRFYATGDLMRREADGTLHFVGRIDEQMKLYGIRIEPGEIVAHLVACPGIIQAAVRVVERRSGRQRLVAYVHASAGFDEVVVREALKRRLPGYLMPAVFVPVRKIHRTASGKCDWTRMPDSSLLDGDGREGPADRLEVAAEGAVAAKIAELFRQVLKVSTDVGPEDDFFALGGDSLAAMTVILQADRHGLDLRPRHIYELKTPRLIAQALAAGGDGGPARLAAPGVMPDAKGAGGERPRSKRRRPTKAVLMTGATGFLGAHVLDDLIAERGVRVRCLVRGPSVGDARARLLRALTYYFGPARVERLSGGLEVVAGDIAAERLGLDQLQWRELGRGVDGVVHAAADVRFFANSSVIHAANVEGTQRMIDVALHGRAWFTYVSTLSLNHMTPDDLPYLASKRDAEALVTAQEDLDYGILRVGLLTSRYRDGVMQPNIADHALFSWIRRALLAGESDAAEVGDQVQLTPVDLCARALGLLTMARPRSGTTIDVGHPQWLNIGDIVTSESRGRTAVPAPRTPAVLRRRGFEWPVLDERYLARVFSFLRQAGFLPPLASMPSAPLSPDPWPNISS